MSRFSVVAKQLSDARMQRSNRTVSPSTLCGIEGPDSISTYYYYKPFGAIKCSEGSMHVISLSHSHCVEVAQTFPLRYDNLFQVRTIVNSKDQSASEAERFSVIIEPRLCYPRASANITSGRHERAATPLCLRRTCCILHPRLKKTRVEAGGGSPCISEYLGHVEGPWSTFCSCAASAIHRSKIQLNRSDVETAR
jgi:hypothetical protein